MARSDCITVLCRESVTAQSIIAVKAHMPEKLVCHHIPTQADIIKVLYGRCIVCLLRSECGRHCIVWISQREFARKRTQHSVVITTNGKSFKVVVPDCPSREPSSPSLPSVHSSHFQLPVRRLSYLSRHYICSPLEIGAVDAARYDFNAPIVVVTSLRVW